MVEEDLQDTHVNVLDEDEKEKTLRKNRVQLFRDKVKRETSKPKTASLQSFLICA